jgi:hypothetical protein
MRTNLSRIDVQRMVHISDLQGINSKPSHRHDQTNGEMWINMWIWRPLGSQDGKPFALHYDEYMNQQPGVESTV